MRNAGLVERIAPAREAELPVEGHGLHLRVQVWFADAEPAGLLEQPEQDLRADATPTMPGNNRDAADLTGAIQPAGANWVTIQERKDVNAARIFVIPLVFFRYFLFFDEDGAADALEFASVRGPVREDAFYGWDRHGRRRQRARASASARPVYDAGVRLSSRRRASSGRPSVATKSRSSGAPTSRPRVKSLSFS